MKQLFSFKKILPRMFKVFSQTAYDYADSSLSRNDSRQKLTFKAGQRLPYIEPKFCTQFSAPAFHVLHISNEKMKTNTAKAIHDTFPFPIQIVEQPLTEAWQKLGVRSDLFILIRPDTYIAYLSDEFDAEQWKAYLNKYFFGVVRGK